MIYINYILHKENYSAWQEEEGQQSLECIQANQIFPRKPPVLEEDDLQVSRDQDTCQDVY